MNVKWTTPATPGNYYVQAVIEVRIGGKWEELSREWIDGGVREDPITVTNDHPVILVHGWKDKSGAIFENLEMMIEARLKRPVRFFQYETATIGRKFDFERLGSGSSFFWGGAKAFAVSRYVRQSNGGTSQK